MYLEHDDPGFRTLTPRNLLATQVFPSVPGAREYGVIGWSAPIPAIGGRFYSENLYFCSYPNPLQKSDLDQTL